MWAHGMQESTLDPPWEGALSRGHMPNTPCTVDLCVLCSRWMQPMPCSRGIKLEHCTCNHITKWPSPFVIDRNCFYEAMIILNLEPRSQCITLTFTRWRRCRGLKSVSDFWLMTLCRKSERCSVKYSCFRVSIIHTLFSTLAVKKMPMSCPFSWNTFLGYVTLIFFYSAPYRGAEYSDEHVCVFVCMTLQVYLQNYRTLLTLLHFDAVGWAAGRASGL